jgi:hypothetical protein
MSRLAELKQNMKTHCQETQFPDRDSNLPSSAYEVVISQNVPVE